MIYRLANLKDYPYQPIKNFADARNYFIRDLPDNEYVLFTSDHEEVPQMLHNYIRRLEPKYPYYRIRLIRLIDGKLESLFDPTYQANLCSNRMRFIGWPEHPNCRGEGTIDIPMLHNKKASEMHSYPVHHLPLRYRKKYVHFYYRLFSVFRQIMWDELHHGLFHKGDERLY